MWKNMEDKLTCHESSPLRLPEIKNPQKGSICSNLRANSISFKIQRGNLNQKRTTVSISKSASRARERTHTHIFTVPWVQDLTEVG